jgi:uncharacterized membrane protein YdjX (TVP38/TMEM64 family)
MTSTVPEKQTSPDSPEPPPARRRTVLRKLLPLIVLVLAVILCFVFGGPEYLTFESLRENREWLMQVVAERPVLSVLAFLAIYVLTVTLSVPGATILTIAAGFLFGQAWGTVLSVVAATVGATALFLIAKTTVGDALRAKAGPWLKRMEAGFAEGALSYMLVLRLVPLFPFFVVNLVPAFIGVPLGIFVVTTFFGIIPGTFVYASVGAGLGSVFEADGDFAPQDALTPEVITALIGLAVLSLLPVAYRKLAQNRRPRG